MSKPKMDIKKAVEKAAAKHLPKAIDEVARSKAYQMAHAASRDDDDPGAPQSAGILTRQSANTPTPQSTSKGIDREAGVRHGVHGPVGK